MSKYRSQRYIYGKFSPISYKNTYDTLTIHKNGTYNRVIYDKKGKKLLNYDAKYLWKSTLTIKFNDFYLNLDKDLIAFPEDVNDLNLTYTSYFEKKESKIIICFGYHDGENFYKKIVE